MPKLNLSPAELDQILAQRREEALRLEGEARFAERLIAEMALRGLVPTEADVRLLLTPQP